MAKRTKSPELGIRVVERAGGTTYRAQLVRGGKTWLDGIFTTIGEARDARSAALTQAKSTKATWVKKGEAVGEMLLSDALDLMLAKQKVAPKTAHEDKLRAEVLKKRWGKVKVKNLSGNDLEDFMNERMRYADDDEELDGLADWQIEALQAGRVKGTTIRQFLGIISKTYKALKRSLHYTEPNPAQHVVWPRQDKALNHEERYIPDEHFQSILSTTRRLEDAGWAGAHGIRTKLKSGSTTLFAFLGTGGTRLSEALRMTTTNARAEYLSINLSKTDVSRTIPRFDVLDKVLNKRLAEVGEGGPPRQLMWHEPGQPFEAMDSRWAWNVVMRELGFTYRRHDLRHTACSNLVLRTEMRQSEISAITGHTSDTIDRYIHLRNAKLAHKAALIGATLTF